MKVGLRQRAFSLARTKNAHLPKHALAEAQISDPPPSKRQLQVFANRPYLTANGRGSNGQGKMVNSGNIDTSYRDDRATTARHKKAHDGVEPRLYPTHLHVLSSRERDFSVLEKVSSGFVSRTSASRGPASKTGQSTLGPSVVTNHALRTWKKVPDSAIEPSIVPAEI